MKPRFLIAIARNGAPGADAARLTRATGLERVFEQGTVIAFANRACRGFALDGQGLILGTLFHRHGRARAMESLTAGETSAVLADRGDTVLRRFWGGYVAAFLDAAGAQILRDPSGALPCYYAGGDAQILLASDVELLLRAGFKTAIDHDALGRHLWSAALPTPKTVLCGINELLPGFAIDLPREPGHQQVRWSPWDHVDPPAWDMAETAERLRRTVRHCVSAWTSARTRPVLSVSGGLDSSIVAVGMTDAEQEAHCITLYGEDASGDERDHARALCAHLRLPLAERPYRMEDVDIDAALAAHLPRPAGRAQEQAYERAHLALAEEIGADAFVTGNGGDNVFGYSQSAAAIADRLRVEGFSLGAFRTLGDVCRQTGCGPLAAIRAAAVIWRQPHYRWRPRGGFVHPDLRAREAGRALCHPWLDVDPGRLPGKARHVAALLRVQQTLEPGRSLHAPVLHPLLAQPVVEACLAVPSWAWRTGGRDRAVARDAFAVDLPPSIITRRSKGGPDGFGAQIIRCHRRRIRERLLDGRLAGWRFVDPGAIEAALGEASQRSSEENVRLLELVNVEAWLDHWSARLARCDRPPPAELTGADPPSG